MKGVTKKALKKADFIDCIGYDGEGEYYSLFEKFIEYEGDNINSGETPFVMIDFVYRKYGSTQVEKVIRFCDYESRFFNMEHDLSFSDLQEILDIPERD